MCLVSTLVFYLAMVIVLALWVVRSLYSFVITAFSVIE